MAKMKFLASPCIFRNKQVHGPSSSLPTAVSCSGSQVGLQLRQSVHFATLHNQWSEIIHMVLVTEHEKDRSQHIGKAITHSFSF